MSIVKSILSGTTSDAIHIGGTPFLGVEVTADDYGNPGADVSQVVQGGPAEAAGLVPGDLITSLDGHAISSPTGLTDTVLAEKAGANVSVTYVDQYGTTQTANVTLGSGPPR
jgi:S1-C subfamily serine protease